MEKILVTGGLGYIGAHMALLLKEQGYDVVVLDNNWHGRPNTLQYIDIIHGDIRDRNLLDDLFSRHRIDAVMHFAGYIQVGESVAKPAKYYDNNVTATLALLDAVVSNGVKQFIFSSTAALYGNPEYTPIDENHPIVPLNPYGTSKWMIEQALESYQSAYGLRYGILRYFNAAGCDPEGRVGELHEPETHLIPLILQVASGRREHISVYGNDYDTPDGTCLRDYIHVLDLCDAHIRLLEYLKQGGDTACFNLGTGKGYSVMEAIKTVERVTGRVIPVEIAPKRLGDAPVLIADGTKARELLGWQPNYSELEQIIADAWAWEKKLTALNKNLLAQNLANPA